MLGRGTAADMDDGCREFDHISELCQHLRDVAGAGAEDGQSHRARLGLFPDRLCAVHRRLRIDAPDGCGHHVDPRLLD